MITKKEKSNHYKREKNRWKDGLQQQIVKRHESFLTYLKLVAELPISFKIHSSIMVNYLPHIRHTISMRAIENSLSHSFVKMKRNPTQLAYVI